MKEYKTVDIQIRHLMNLDRKLNGYADKGWYVKESLIKVVAEAGYTHRFIYLLERDKPPIKNKNIPKPPSPPPPRKIIEK